MLVEWCLLRVRSFLNFDFVNYFDNYLIGFDNFLRFGFCPFGYCSFAADWLDFYLGIGCFVGCNSLNCSFDLTGSPNFGSLASRIDLNSFVGCRSLDFDSGILGSFVLDSLVSGSLDCKLADCSTSVALVQSLVVAVAGGLLQLRFDVVLVKLFDFGLFVDLVEQLAIVAVV